MDHKNFGPMLDTFVDYAGKELGIKSLPKIRLSNSGDRSFGGYNPSNAEIITVTKNRHPMDIFRTVAHELIHHKQNEDGLIGKDIAQEGSTGSDIENEANSRAGVIMRNYAKLNPDHFSLPTVSEAVLTEGVNDPGIFKAVFLAGGPGSGKDFVMNQTLSDSGLVEINSDHAFEFLMKKNGLDPKMPQSEETPRNYARGRAKGITKEKERLALQGRLGLVINGTADSVEKIETVKSRLEELGYETMMLFVDTSNEVSQMRNVERGQRGGRKVPDGTDPNGVPDGSPDIRLQKWIEAQRNKKYFEELFGDRHFVSFDNSADMRTAPVDVVKKVKESFLKLYKKLNKFTTDKIDNPVAKQWIKDEKVRLQTVAYETTPKNYQYGQDVVPLKTPPADVQFSFQASPKPIPPGSPASVHTQVKKPKSNVPTGNELDQAKAMGLSYYGFGRYGKNISGVNTVTHISQDGKLIPKAKKIEEDFLPVPGKDLIKEVYDLGDTSPNERTVTKFMLPSSGPYKGIYDKDHSHVFSTKTHRVYWHTQNSTNNYGSYIAVNKNTGEADMLTTGKRLFHHNGKTQTYTPSWVEGRKGSTYKAHELYHDIISHPHDGRATILQSDEIQTTGGQKVWKALARKKSVTVHGWDDAVNRPTDVHPNDPDDHDRIIHAVSDSSEIDYTRRKTRDINSIVDPDYREASTLLHKKANDRYDDQLKVNNIVSKRTLVAFKPRTLKSIREEKHIATDKDTIPRLARKYNTSPVLIAKENGLPSIHEPLKNEQELTIPKMPKPKEEKPEPVPIVMSGVLPQVVRKNSENPLQKAKTRASKALQSALNSYGRKKIAEEHGAGDWGTTKLTNRYKKDTPGQEGTVVNESPDKGTDTAGLFSTKKDDLMEKTKTVIRTRRLHK